MEARDKEDALANKSILQTGAVRPGMSDLAKKAAKRALADAPTRPPTIVASSDSYFDSNEAYQRKQKKLDLIADLGPIHSAKP